MATPPALYRQHFIDKGDERIDLFRKIADRYETRSALYPGSFVQVSPSFVIPEVVYVDSDRRIPGFFTDPQVTAYIDVHKEYAARPQVRYFHQSYEKDIGEPLENFDLLISQYAGFVSAACKKYLRIGGILLANDSHGDAGLANLDIDFEFAAVVRRNGERFSISDSRLDEFFIPKRETELTPELLRERGRGVGYTNPASSYIFRKIA